ncbi:MAG: hypothetical protein J7L55_01140 [Desulfurococcales archaeon]|nr:hypothetical protein [Desulfurococcales archaeon]
MTKNKRKEAGKVIIKKKARKAPSLRIRGDILLVAVIIAIIAVGIGYLAYDRLTTQAKQPIPAEQRLYEGLKAVFHDKNPKATLDLIYDVRGNTEWYGVPVSTKDLLMFRLFYYHQTLNTNETSSNATVTLSGWGALPIGASYLYNVLNLTGFTTMINNASQVIININHVKEAFNVSVNKEDLGAETLTLPGFNKPFQVLHYRYSYNIRSEGKVKHVVIDTWLEAKYNLPVKVVVDVDGKALTFTLHYVQFNLSSE